MSASCGWTDGSRHEMNNQLKVEILTSKKYESEESRSGWPKAHFGVIT